MESSLTAPVNGRVREVLVSPNTHVATGRPLLMIEPLEDAQDDDGGGAVPILLGGEASEWRTATSATLLERLRWLVLGYDVPPGARRSGSSTACWPSPAIPTAS